MAKPREPASEDRDAAVIAAIVSGERSYIVGTRFRMSRQTVRVITRKAGLPPRPFRNPWTRVAKR